MRIVQPHEFFYLDFEQILPEAERQEQLLPVNKGEYAIAHKIYRYFDDVVIPSIVHNDWVYEAAYEFATKHLDYLFLASKRIGKEVFPVQTELVKIKLEVEKLLLQAIRDSWAYQDEYELLK